MAEKKLDILHISCYCGACKVEAKPETVFFTAYCHCTICQRVCGAPFTWGIGLPTDNVKVTKGEENIKSIESSPKCFRNFCSKCSSLMYTESTSEEFPFRDISAALVERDDKDAREAFLKDPRFKPNCHMFYPSRVIDIKDGIPKFATYPNVGEPISSE